MNSRNMSVGKLLLPYLYLMPALIMIFVFMIYPVFNSFKYSFFDFNGLSKKFIGLENYHVLMADPDFWNSLKITFIWVALSSLLLPVVGMFLAIFIEFGTKLTVLKSISRTIIFIPMTLSYVSVGLLFSMFFNPTLGVLNSLIHFLGFHQNMDLLGNKHTALYGIFATQLWQWAGFGMVFFTAAIQGISNDYYEASHIDGANKFQLIRYITIPLLRPAYGLIITLNMIGGFKAFDIIWIMTHGGPGNRTETTSVYLYHNAFVLQKYGYASSLAVILFGVILIITYFLNRKNYSSL